MSKSIRSGSDYLLAASESCCLSFKFKLRTLSRTCYVFLGGAAKPNFFGGAGSFFGAAFSAWSEEIFDSSSLF